MRNSFIDYELSPHDFNLTSTVVATIAILALEIGIIIAFTVAIVFIQIIWAIL